jgi:hypothetical protein
MTNVSGELVINRDVDTVFETVADERNSYDTRQRSAELLTDGPIGVGSRFRSEIVTMRRSVSMIVEIVEYDRPHWLVSVTHSPGLDIRSRLRFEPVNGATKMSWSSELRPHGPMKLLAPILGAVARRQTAAIWDGLKRSLEQPPEDTS